VQSTVPPKCDSSFHRNCGTWCELVEEVSFMTSRLHIGVGWGDAANRQGTGTQWAMVAWDALPKLRDKTVFVSAMLPAQLELKQFPCRESVWSWGVFPVGDGGPLSCHVAKALMEIASITSPHFSFKRTLPVADAGLLS
jgi:hypothetical protein